MTQQSEPSRRLLTEQLGGRRDEDTDAQVEAPEGYASNPLTDPDGGVTALQTLGDDTRGPIVGLLTEADRPLCVCGVTSAADALHATEGSR